MLVLLATCLVIFLRMFAAVTMLGYNSVTVTCGCGYKACNGATGVATPSTVVSASVAPGVRGRADGKSNKVDRSIIVVDMLVLIRSTSGLDECDGLINPGGADDTSGH